VQRQTTDLAPSVMNKQHVVQASLNGTHGDRQNVLMARFIIHVESLKRRVLNDLSSKMAVTMQAADLFS
jgi:hypothetical protein